MELKLDEELMTREGEKILLTEKTNEIAEYKSKLLSDVERTQVLLNAIHRLYPLDSVSAIPHDSDGVIMKLYLQRNKPAQTMHAITPLKIDSVVLPDDLKELRFLFGSWTNCHHKEMAAYLLFHSKDGFSLNRGMIEKEIASFTLKNQVWISEPDQLKRYSFSKNVIDAINFETAKNNLDFKKDDPRTNILRGVLMRNPMVRFLPFPENRFQINSQYVLSGQLIM